MALYPCKVAHQQARESYRVVLKDGVSETEIGSIGPQHQAGAVTRWVWTIDTIVPMREHEQTGCGTDLQDCQRRFKAAWEAFASDPSRLVDFLRIKRQRT